MSIDLLERGIVYIRWSLLIISADTIILALLLLLSLLITPMAAYIFTVVVSYFLLISTVIPYVLVVLFWLLGFRDLMRYSGRYLMGGFVGSVIITVSYFMNIAYMGYLIANELVGNALIPRPIMLEPLILMYNRYFIVFSLYLPLPLFVSLILGILGSILSMVTLYRLGNDFNVARVKIGALITIIGVLTIEAPLIGGLLISAGTALLMLDLGRILNEINEIDKVNQGH
ncbi:hypothetical protein [Vulcanisaeta distributa]|uniref:hypothetical protein n=1 Tax=Vulcanisaeta distributa TaxID=164451 RepID=UPI0006D1E308|nr:hypothetical protein [Vulcanisaeta distributa]